MEFSLSFFKTLFQFIKDVANDPRIPERDKAIILALLALIASPIDIIPDWIPFIGVMDDLIMISLVLDYFFNVLDSEVLLSHYPWGMKSFLRIKRSARMVALLTPEFIKRKIWKYQPDPYKGRF